MTRGRYTGFMYQADATDARLGAVELVRAFIARYAATRGGRPDVALVHGGEWPAEIDGVRMVPSPAIPYPTWAILVMAHSSSNTEEPHDTANG